MTAQLRSPVGSTQLLFDRTLATTLLICGVGLGLRLWGLASESLWLDEATSLVIARKPLGELIRYLLQEDVHPPLYFLLLHFWRVGGEDVAYLRLFSVLTGVLALPVICLLCQRLFSSGTGLVAAGLLAIAPLHVYYSQMVRNYSLYFLLALVSFYCLLKAVDENTWRWWALYLGSALGALYTHYFAVIAVVFQNVLMMLLVVWRQQRLWVWRRWAITSMLLVLLFMAWVVNSAVLTYGASPGWLSDATAPSVTAISSLLSLFSFGLTAGLYPRWMRLASYGLIACLLAMATLSLKPVDALARVRNHIGLQLSWGYLSLPLVIIWLASQVRPLFVGRYLIPYLAPYLILLAAGVMAMPLFWRPWFVVGLSALVALPGLWLTFQVPQEEDWRVATAYVLGRAQPGDVVVFSPPWYVKPFDYYARGRVTYFESQEIFEPESVCRAAPVGHSRVWLIQPYDKHWTDPTDNLNACLDAHLVRLGEFRFPPKDGRIVLYQVNIAAQHPP